MTYPGDLLGDIELLKYLADLSDEISSSRFLAQDLKIESKPDLSPVTDADRAVEEKIREVLKAQRPNDKIVGEEFGSAEDIKAMDRYWVIDPIDGTKNFLRGLPIWATLVLMAVLADSARSEDARVTAGSALSDVLSRTGGQLSADDMTALQGVVNGDATPMIKAAAARAFGNLAIDAGARAKLLSTIGG